MYFDLPKRHERIKNNNSSSSSNKINNSFGMAEERLSEIMNNLQDHWHSPPLLTPETLSFILSNQWVTATTATTASTASDESTTPQTILDNNNKIVHRLKENQVINNLIKELCQVIETIDTEKKHDITNQIENDSVLQDIRNGEDTVVADEKTLEHLVQLLRHHNNKT